MPDAASRAPLILAIDDEAPVRESLRRYLEDFDYRVLEAADGKAGLELFRREGPDLVLVDLRMPELSGLEVLETLTRDAPGVPIIVVSGAGEISNAIEALRLGAWDYLLKPIADLARLRHAVEKALERARLLRENRAYQRDLEALVQKRAEQLQESEAKYRALFDHSGEAIFILDDDRVIECNQKALELLGADRLEIVGKAPVEFAPVVQPEGSDSGEQLREYLDAALRGSPQCFPFYFLRRGDEPFEAEISLARVEIGGLSRLSALVRDVTEKRRLEDQLRQAQKMEAIGQLAGGVAHDFNNLLTGIMGYAEVLAAKLEDPTLQDSALEIIGLSQRAADLTSQLLTFSRRSKPRMVKLEIHQALREVIKLLSRTIDRKIEIQTRLLDRPAHVMGDPNQLQNALLNLGINARDAMTEGGTMTFSTAIKSLAKGHGRAFGFELEAGYYLELAVADTGIGMAPATIRRVFEPFFTTKGTGKGAGLGLSSVYGVVRAHQGGVTVESEPGAGTTFRLYLSLLAEEEEERKM